MVQLEKVKEEEDSVVVDVVAMELSEEGMMGIGHPWEK